MAQTNTNSVTAAEGAKVLVDDAIQALKNNESNKAVVHLNLINQQLPVLGNSSSSVPKNLQNLGFDYLGFILLSQFY
jgi:FMN-dependent NADH-azoreductase